MQNVSQLGSRLCKRQRHLEPKPSYSRPPQRVEHVLVSIQPPIRRVIPMPHCSYNKGTIEALAGHGCCFYKHDPTNVAKALQPYESHDVTICIWRSLLRRKADCQRQGRPPPSYPGTECKRSRVVLLASTDKTRRMLRRSCSLAQGAIAASTDG